MGSKYGARAAPGEWYHCYNRGVEKRNIFMNHADYRRFQLLLLCSNTTQSFMLSNVRRKDYETLYTHTPSNIDMSLVQIGAYALMPNHFHIVLKEITEGGRAKFMQKLITGYTMYFNKRHTHSGPLLAGTYKATHIDSDRYLRHVSAYVLLNPVELEIPNWKEKLRLRPAEVNRAVASYPYSSAADQLSKNPRPESMLVESATQDIYDGSPKIADLLKDALEYYRARAH